MNKLFVKVKQVTYLSDSEDEGACKTPVETKNKIKQAPEELNLENSIVTRACSSLSNNISSEASSSMESPIVIKKKESHQNETKNLILSRLKKISSQIKTS